MSDKIIKRKVRRNLHFRVTLGSGEYSSSSMARHAFLGWNGLLSKSEKDLLLHVRTPVSEFGSILDLLCDFKWVIDPLHWVNEQSQWKYWVYWKNKNKNQKWKATLVTFFKLQMIWELSRMSMYSLMGN